MFPNFKSEVFGDVSGPLPYLSARIHSAVRTAVCTRACSAYIETCSGINTDTSVRSWLHNIETAVKRTAAEAGFPAGSLSVRVEDRLPEDR